MPLLAKVKTAGRALLRLTMCSAGPPVEENAPGGLQQPLEQQRPLADLGLAAAEVMRKAAAEGDLLELRRLLAADPGLATVTDSSGRSPLWWAAARGPTDAVRLLLEAAPAAALTADAKGWLPLHTAASLGSAEAVRMLLEAAPAAALTADEKGRLPLHIAAYSRGTEVVHMLLEAAPAAALTADQMGRLPLHEAALNNESTGAVRLLLEAAPAAALRATARGSFPLHVAAWSGRPEVVRLLLEAAPGAALRADAQGRLPLHAAASSDSAEAVRLLLEAAPAAALTADGEGRLPLQVAGINGRAEAVRLLLEAAPAGALTIIMRGEPLLHTTGWRTDAVRLLLEAAAAEVTTEAQAGSLLNTVLRLHRLLRITLRLATRSAALSGPALRTARRLLAATPPEFALSALEESGQVALPLFANLAASTALSPAQWRRVPPCSPGLGAALPAVLARSEAEAALLVGRLPAETRQRLRIGALCLGRAQREHQIELPAALVGQVLALAAGA